MLANHKFVYQGGKEQWRLGGGGKSKLCLEVPTTSIEVERIKTSLSNTVSLIPMPVLFSF